MRGNPENKELVVDKALSGMTDSQIARELGISIKSVEKYRQMAGIMRKPQHNTLNMHICIEWTDTINRIRKWQGKPLFPYPDADESQK